MKTQPLQNPILFFCHPTAKPQISGLNVKVYNLSLN